MLAADTVPNVRDGTLVQATSYLTNYCVLERYLVEHSCDVDSLRQTLIDCPYGCFDGVSRN